MVTPDKETHMAKQPDEYDALRQMVTLLQPFKREDQERILRWTREKLGLAGEAQAPPSPTTAATPSAGPTATTDGQRAQASEPTPTIDIKTFVESKKPKSDIQFAATVAYYYQFKTSEEQRKEEITKDDLVTACRLAKWQIPRVPNQTLNNACYQGLLDKGTARGAYKLNSVGENLVAMVLPEGSESQGGNKKHRQTRKKANKPKVSKQKKVKKTKRKPRR